MIKKHNKIFFILIILILNLFFNKTYASYYTTNQTLPQVDNIISKYNNKKLISKYIQKLDSIEGKISDKKENIYNLIMNSFQKKYDELDKRDQLKNLNFNIKKLATKVKKIVKINNDNFEFEENGNTYKVIPNEGLIKIENDPHIINNLLKKYKTQDQILMIYNGSYLMTTSGFDIEKKITKSKLLSQAKTINDKETFFGSGFYIAKINDDYYKIIENNFIEFSLDGFYLSSYSNKNSSPKKITDLLVLNNDNGHIKLIFDYKLIPLNTKPNIETNKELVSAIIEEDKNFSDFSGPDIDKQINNALQEIKIVTLNIIKNKKTDDEKIKAIYKWIIDNISYDEGAFNAVTKGTNLEALNRKEIYSGIQTYKNKNGVCSGYVKLFVYMLSFAGIKDVSIKTGFIINSPSFPNYTHVWVKIGDYYYDPTIDDDDSSDTEGINESNFRYFKLPKELMYADRFDGYTREDISNEYLQLDQKSRDDLVKKNLYKIALNPNYNNYLLLIPYINKIKLGLGYNEKLTIEKIKKTLPYIEIFYDKNGHFFNNSNGIKKYIKIKESYLILDNNDVKIPAYKKIDKLILIKWVEKDGTGLYGLIEKDLFNQSIINK